MNATERDRYFQYGHFAKTVEFSQDSIYLYLNAPKYVLDCIDEDDNLFDGKDLIMLLEYLPNIQNVYCCTDIDGDTYAGYIHQNNSKKCLIQLKCFQGGKESTYIEVCYKYRASITTIIVNYEDILQSPYHQIAYFSQFSRLTSLTLSNNCDHRLTTFDIQKMCICLAELNYFSNLNIPDERIKECLGDPDNCNLGTKLKSFTLSVPSVPVNYARYIADFFSEVECLKFYLNDIDLYEWADDIGMKNVLLLLRRLGTLNDVGFTFVSKRTNRDNLKSGMAAIFELLNTFKVSKKTYTRVEFTGFPTHHNSIHFNLQEGLSFIYELHDNEYYISNQTEVGHNLSVVDQYFRSAVSEITNFLTITLCDSDPKLILKLIEYALIRCPNLAEFYMNLTGETWGAISITSNIYQENKSLNRNNSVKKKQGNLKVVKAAGFELFEELLNMISTYLPNIEVFAFGDPKRKIETPQRDEIDITMFNELQTFFIDVKSLFGYEDEGTHGKLSSEADYSFIIFKYIDEEEAYYCKTKEYQYALIPTTLEFMQECLDNKGLVSSSISIRCSKNVKFIVRWSSSFIIAEFFDGKLDYISIDSCLLNSMFFLF